MHGVAALKELLRRYEKLNEELQTVSVIQNDNKFRFLELEKKVSKETEDLSAEEEKYRLLEEEVRRNSEALIASKEEEERLSTARKLANEKSLLEFQAQLTRERLQREEEFAKLEMQENLKMERELAEQKERFRQEAYDKVQARKQELNQELVKQKTAYEKEKIRAEIEAKAKQERDNEDVNIRKLKLQAELEGQQIISAINTVFDEFGNLVLGVISQPFQLAAVCGVILLFVFAYYSIKELVAFIRSTVQSYIGKPSLIRETNMKWHFLPAFLADYFFAEDASQSLLAIESHFRDVILSVADRERVIQLALTTRNTKNSKAPYRHVLLHGPPGKIL